MKDGGKSIIEIIICTIIEEMQKKLQIQFGSDVKPEANLSKDIGFDSLNLVVFFSVLEDIFNVDIHEEEIVRSKTIQDAINLLIAKLKEEVCYGFIGTCC